MAEIVCSFCGTKALAGSIFCDQCGSDLRTAGRENQVASAPTHPETIIGMASLARTPVEDMLPVFAVPPTSLPPLATLLGRLKLPDANVTIELPATLQEAVVGREDPASGVFPEINLDPYNAQDAGVSRRHIRIFVSAGKLFVEDLNTVNGTFLNQRKLDPGVPAPLQSGDELRLGKFMLVYMIH